MKFSDVIGHKALGERLRQSINGGRIPHAQLFTGAAGYGTLPLALAYIQYLNCEHRTAEDSCGECPSCHQMRELAHPDLHIVMPVNKQGKKSGEVVLSDDFIALWRREMSRSGGYLQPEEWYDAMDLGKTLKGVISAREADEVIKRLSFKSFSSGYKAMVIWLPEMMNEQAANKLLKILEEPWDDTLFILVSERPERLLPTILSRTQQLAVPQIETSVLQEYAARNGVSDVTQQMSYANLAAGDILELKRLLSGEGAGQREEFFELFTRLMRLSYNDKHLELMGWAEDVAQLTRADQLGMLRYSLMLLREAYIRHAGLENICYTWGAEADFCTKFAPFIGNENIEFLIGQIEEAIAQISQNANPTILFTHFALIVSKEIKRR